MARFVDMRPGEKRPTIAAFVTLLGITAGHTLLETARDALFLAKLPASRLPWVYLGIAAVGLLASRFSGRRARGSSSGRLAFGLLASAGITTAFWLGCGLRAEGFLYALYLWTGIFASWVVVQFWLLLGDRFTVIQAKRLYGFIGAGAVLGAVFGASLARSLAALLPAQHLLLGASTLFVATALGPTMLLQSGEAPKKKPRADEAARPVSAGSLTDDLRVARDHPYVRRILLLVLLGSISVTIVDYLFKAQVAAEVPAAELGAFFATVYVVLNSVALVVQLFAVGFILRTFGVHRAVVIMPLLLFLGAGGVLAGGGLIAAVLLKGADGSLRHSLNRTSTELLYVPLPDALRARVKPFIDLVGQRGGQAVASIAILGMVALGGERLAQAAAVLLLTATTLVVAAGLRKPYLDLFRETLRGDRADASLELPELDLAALEALFAALNSQKNAEVLGALDLLAAQKRERLIPALILYHPSPAVVTRALEIFSREGRTDFVPIAGRLLAHADANVRAAALRARTAVQPDQQYLRERSRDDCLEVRATAIVGLVSQGWLAGEEGSRALDELARDPSSAIRVALAKAIAAEPSPRFEPALRVLLESDDAEVLLEAAWAAGRTKNPRFLPRLLALLGERLPSAAARDAIAEMGSAGLDALDAAAGDATLSDAIRGNVPRALSAFSAELAAPILQKHLEATTDGMMRYRILRALQRLRALEPTCALDEPLLTRVTEKTIQRATELLAARVSLARATEAEPAHRTNGRQLLDTLLRDKEVHAIGRIFRLFGLLYPGESFERIQRGLAKNDPKARASSRELIEHLVAPSLRASVLALVEDDLPDEARLARVDDDHRPAEVPELELLSALAARSDELGELARHHAAELGMRLTLARAPKRISVLGKTLNEAELGLAGTAHAT